MLRGSSILETGSSDWISSGAISQ